MTTDQEPSEESAWRPRLSLGDATSLMIGIVVGTAVFVLPPMIFSNVSSAGMGLGAWLIGGVLSLIGGLVFAEMAVSIPKGGAYAYLTSAFGRTAGFVYGAALITIILTTTIGQMAFAFANYANGLLSSHYPEPLLASGAILLLALLNSWSHRTGRLTQNLLTAAKMLGLGGIALAGFLAESTTTTAPSVAATTPADASFGVALVLVLYAYGGWSDAATVAAEVHDHHRNIPRALALGLFAVMAIYLLVNLSYLRVLGLEGLRHAERPAQATLAAVMGPRAGKALALLVMVSALGAIHGMLFSGARSVAALAEDHVVFRSLKTWSRRGGVPARAVWLLTAIALIQVATIGTEAGRSILDRVVQILGFESIPWDRFHGGFETLVAASAPTFWGLMLGTAAAFFQLRRTGQSPREFACPGAPLLPLIFAATCGFMLWNSIGYAGAIGLLGLVPCAVAAVAAQFSGRRRA